MRRSSVVVLASLALLIAMAIPASAKADRQVFVFETPLDTVVTVCSGEDVHITGTERSERWETVTRTGGEHINWKVEWDASGVGLDSGDEYKVSYSLHQVANGKPPFAPPTSQVVTHIVTLRVGSGLDGLVRRTHSHRVLDFETGEVKVLFSKDSRSC